MHTSPDGTQVDSISVLHGGEGLAICIVFKQMVQVILTQLVLRATFGTPI